MRIRGVVVTVLGVLPLVAGCGADFAVPRTAAECYEAAPDQGGHHYSDAASGWNLAYSEDSRSLGSSISIYVCGPSDVPATVSVDPLPGLEVDPDPLEVSGDPDVVGELRLTVTDEMQETLHVVFGDGGGSLDIEVDAADGEWSLRPQ